MDKFLWFVLFMMFAVFFPAALLVPVTPINWFTISLAASYLAFVSYMVGSMTIFGGK
jgi:hypothetical protein